MSTYLEQLKLKLSSDNAPQEPIQPAVAVETEKTTYPPTMGDKAPTVTETAPIQELPKKEEKKDNQFYLSQTIIKAITNYNGDYKEVCPKAMFHKYVEGKYRTSTAPMLEGIYAETLCLGGGAKGQAVYDLPRHKKNGEKLTSQMNIEEQARRFPIWCNANGISIIPGVNTQVPIIKKFGEKRYIRTEIDIFPTPFLVNGEYKLAVMDLKFTADINSKFGPKNSMEIDSTPSGGWGAPEYIDHCQADLTYWLLEDFDMELNVKHNPHMAEIYQSVFGNESIVNMIKNEDIMFIYFIIGYKKQPLSEQIMFLHREYREPHSAKGTFNNRRKDLLERIRKTYAQLNEWALSGWPVRPGSLCDKCPANKANGGECEMAPKIKTI